MKISLKINMLLLVVSIIAPSALYAQIVDACASEGPTSGSSLTLNDAVCVPNGSNSNSIQYYYVLVPANTSTLYIRGAHGSGNGNVYYNASTWATSSSYTHSSTNSGNTESINVSNPAQGYRYISVVGQRTGMTLLVSTTNPGGSSSGGSSSGGSSSGGSSSGGSSSGGSSSGSGLSNGQTVSGLSAAQGAYSATYYIDVPSGASNLKIAASGGTGDADLYVKKGSEPTDSSYDCRPYDSGNNETCGVGGDSLPTSAGRFYIKLKAYSAFSGVSLTASYDTGSGSSGGSSSGGSSSGGSSSGGSSSGGSSSGGSSSGGGLSNGQTVSGLSASQGSYTSAYYIDVPTGASNLKISISGGSGDADLYVKKGSEPTDSSYDCRPYVGGNNETCGVGGTSLPTSAGRFYIKIKAYSTFSGVNLTASYDTGSGSSGGSSSGGSSSGGSSGGQGNYDGYDYDYVHVIIFPFEFSDKPLEWTNAQIEASMQEVKTYFAEQSYGQFNVTWEIRSKMLASGGNSVSYAADFFAWRDHYEQRITATGVNIDNPGTSTLIMMTAPNIGYNSAASPVLLTNYHHTSGVTAHEMGHALGLRHAMALEAGNSVISGGSGDEVINYGNAASLMGAGGHTLEEINLMYKSYFGWIDNSNAPLITTSNTYRIYAFDHGTTTGTGAPGNIGLRIKSGNGLYTYYLEYRTTGRYANDFVNSGSSTTWPGSKNGVLFNLQGYLDEETDQTFWEHKSLLLDMTPNSQSTATWYNNDNTDAALLIGKSYTDYWGGFRVTVLGKGGVEDTGDAWIEVEVTML